MQLRQTGPLPNRRPADQPVGSDVDRREVGAQRDSRRADVPRGRRRLDRRGDDEEPRRTEVTLGGIDVAAGRGPERDVAVMHGRGVTGRRPPPFLRVLELVQRRPQHPAPDDCREQDPDRYVPESAHGDETSGDVTIVGHDSARCRFPACGNPHMYIPSFPNPSPFTLSPGLPTLPIREYVSKEGPDRDDARSSAIA